MTIQHLTAGETAALIYRALRARWPDVTFVVQYAEAVDDLLGIVYVDWDESGMDDAAGLRIAAGVQSVTEGFVGYEQDEDLFALSLEDEVEEPDGPERDTFVRRVFVVPGSGRRVTNDVVTVVCTGFTVADEAARAASDRVAEWRDMYPTRRLCYLDDGAGGTPQAPVE